MKKDKIIKWCITTLLILLPFLDMLRTTNIRHFEILGISIIEIFNILLIGTAFILTLFKCNKKELFGVTCYLVLIAIYVVLHYNHIINFDKSIFPKADFNFLTETFYIGRVYVLPLALLFVLIKNRDIFNKDFYFKIIKIVIAIISFSIVILNVLKLSYISYSSSHDFVTHNIFDYFLYQGDFRLLSARGWFDSANEISAIMFMLFPINIYLLYKEGKIFNYVLFISQFLAMILLGTRTSAVGAIIISIFAFLMYIITIFCKVNVINEKFIKYFVVCSLTCIAFCTISPFMIARLSEGKTDFSIQNQDAYTDLNDSNDEKQLSALIEKYKSEYLINELYLEMYPVKGDVLFWLDVASRNKTLNSDGRRMKTDIIKRIKERNNNNLDTYLGLGYTLNMMDLERDYYFQYYIFGIVGMLLLMGPYFAILVYLMIKGFINFKKNFNFKTILCLMGPILGFLIAYYSGHVFGWVSPMMWLVVTLVLIYNIIFENNLLKNKELEKKIQNNKKKFIKVLDCILK